MDLEIREIERAETSLGVVFDVCRSSFPDISIDRLRSNWFHSHPETTFYGAFAGERLVAVNGFIAHSILVRGSRSVARQSCWSATRPDFRGKGLFSRLIEHAKHALRGRSAFIFGFPNAVSGPILTGKLGFSEIGMTRVVYLARAPAALLRYQIDSNKCFEGLMAPNLVRFDQYECAAWKKHEHGPALLEIEHNTNYVWGVVATRKFAGTSMRTFLAGGCELNKPQLSGHLLQCIARASGASLIRFVVARTGLLPSCSRWTLAGDRTEPFVYHPVDMLTEDLTFDTHSGLKDVF